MTLDEGFYLQILLLSISHREWLSVLTRSSGTICQGRASLSNNSRLMICVLLIICIHVNVFVRL